MSLGSVGRPWPQIDAVDKVRGRTRYAADMTLPGQLYGRILRSPVPHGIIRRIDTSRALKVPGVRAVITAADLPPNGPEGKGRVPFGPYVDDWEILCSDRVRYIGDEVAAVAAVSEEAAAEALELIEVEYEPLPAVFDMHEALEPGAPVLWPERPGNIASRFDIARGDLDAARRKAHLVLEERYSTNRIYHAYLEPIAVLAEAHPGDRYTLIAPTHIPYKARVTYARGLGIDPGKIRLIVPPMGGSFGAKYELNVCMIAMLLARKTGRPVKMVFDRAEDAAAGHHRPPLHFDIRLALDRDGRFLSKEVRIVATAGARTMWTPPVVATAAHRIDALYHFEAVRAEALLVYTNTSPTTCMRGFGNAEMLFAFEQMVDQAAEELGIDPVEIRKRNAVRAGDVTIHGWRIGSSALEECLDRVALLSGFSRRKPAPRHPPASGKARGLGLAIGHHVSGYRPILAEYDGSAAWVRLDMDGRLSVAVGEPDIGQGLNTVVAMIAADELGVSPSEIDVMPVDTAHSPAAVGTLGSRATIMAGAAVKAAARDFKKKLLAFAGELLGADPGELVLERGRVLWRRGGGESGEREGGPGASLTLAELGRRWAAAHTGSPLVGQGSYRPETVLPGPDKYGNPSPAYPFAAHVAEVEVDVETGAVEVVNYWAVHDSGRIINPSTATGQVQGGVAQGIGWALMEDVAIRGGRVENPNFLDYRIPGFQDVPPMTVEFVGESEPNSPTGVKSLGESALNPVLPAIANAVYNAVGVRIHDAPLTPEAVWRAIQRRREELEAAGKEREAQ